MGCLTPPIEVHEHGRTTREISLGSLPMTCTCPGSHKMRKITVVGKEKMVVFDDMELERKVTNYDKYPWKQAESYGEWQTRSGDITIPKIPTDEPLRLECEHFLALVRSEGGDRQKVARDGAMVGKQPVLSPRSTASRGPLPPAVIGDGTVIAQGATVFAGARLGVRVLVGDGACVRERCVIGDDVVVGHGSLVENDTTVGARTKIQALAYVTASTTVEEDVFIAH